MADYQQTQANCGHLTMAPCNTCGKCPSCCPGHRPKEKDKKKKSER